ncbi:hypothetical protein FQZ97_485550 [compost metagenome]
MAPQGISVWLSSANTMASRGCRFSGRINSTVPSMPTPKPVADSANGPTRKQAKNNRLRRASASPSSAAPGPAALPAGARFCAAMCQNSSPPRM